MKFYIKLTKVGKVTVVENNNKIERIILGSRICDGEENETNLIREVFDQLNLYLDGKIKEIKVPYRMIGTEFQKRVWQELLKVKYGHIETYKRIATLIDHPKSARAVGNACGKNPLAILIPCHRVVSLSGNKLNYVYGAEIKKFLLNLEGVNL